MKMSEPLQPTLWQETELPLMSSQADSRAKTSVQQARRLALARTLEAVYSGKCLDLLLKYAPSLSSLKTSHGFSADQKKRLANGSGNFSGPWPRSGMMQNGLVLPLPALERRTSETASGLLPTPTRHNSKEGAYPAEYTRNTPTLATHAGGKINPAWSEHLMGFPIKWTDLQP